MDVARHESSVICSLFDQFRISRLEALSPKGSHCGRHMPTEGDPPAAVARLGVSRQVLQAGEPRQRTGSPSGASGVTRARDAYGCNIGEALASETGAPPLEIRLPFH
ncbi:hypothetical protein SD80_015825 [Scytonema tolypothrichoides VB-61278]|nr:hypothetical protein SD80_015825 [Scytonema tolypothrichoides VB-61278]